MKHVKTSLHPKKQVELHQLIINNEEARLLLDLAVNAKKSAPKVLELIPFHNRLKSIIEVLDNVVRKKIYKYEGQQ